MIVEYIFNPVKAESSKWVQKTKREFEEITEAFEKLICNRRGGKNCVSIIPKNM